MPMYHCKIIYIAVCNIMSIIYKYGYSISNSSQYVFLLISTAVQKFIYVHSCMYKISAQYSWHQTVHDAKKFNLQHHNLILFLMSKQKWKCWTILNIATLHLHVCYKYSFITFLHDHFTIWHLFMLATFFLCCCLSSGFNSSLWTSYLLA